MMLRQAWLTVALSLQLPALAWITGKLATRPLRLLASVMAVKGLAFALVLVYLTLEVRHAFQGSVLLDHHASDLEYYAYSMVWLLFAGALLAPGILLGNATLRYASLGVLMLTVIKVFIGDMSDLTGLTRVASFLLLGLSLVGIGWLYQRFVFPLDRSPAPPTATEQI